MHHEFIPKILAAVYSYLTFTHPSLKPVATEHAHAGTRGVFSKCFLILRIRRGKRGKQRPAQFSHQATWQQHPGRDKEGAQDRRQLWLCRHDLTAPLSHLQCTPCLLPPRGWPTCPCCSRMEPGDWMRTLGLKRYRAPCIALGIPSAHPPPPGTCTPWLNTCCRDWAPTGTQGPLHTGYSSQLSGTLVRIA